MQGHGIHGVLPEHILEDGVGLGLAAKFSQDAPLEILRLIIASVVGYGLVQAVQGHLPIALLCIYLGQLGVGARIIGIVPGGTIQGVKGRFSLPLCLENQAQIVHGLGILGTGVVVGLPADCGAQIGGGLVVFSPQAVPYAHLGIGAGVARIAAQDLFEIVGRVNEWIVELQVAKAHQVAFLGVGNIGRLLGTLHDGRQRRRRVFHHRSE